MSLSLLQGYSSDEEGADDPPAGYDEDTSPSVSDGDVGDTTRSRSTKGRSVFDHPSPSSNSLLPSALEVFSEVAGPPEFLNNSAGQGDLQHSAPAEADHRWLKKKGGKMAREKKDLPAGVVVEAKAQLIGIRDHVRSDVEGKGPPSGPVHSVPGEKSRLISATNPELKDAADLLRMCVQCGIPKTYSHAKGMVCPVCGDRPLPDPDSVPEKKKGSTIKDKEKSKRMKGQSSHSAWKSETEMQLRQQFD